MGSSLNKSTASLSAGKLPVREVGGLCSEPP